MAQSAVRFDQVRKSHGHQAVLQRINIEVAAGVTFGLVGINGAGKTTLIKYPLDFCHVDGGRIDIFGTRHTDLCQGLDGTILPQMHRKRRPCLTSPAC